MIRTAIEKNHIGDPVIIAREHDWSSPGGLDLVRITLSRRGNGRLHIWMFGGPMGEPEHAFAFRQNLLAASNKDLEALAVWLTGYPREALEAARLESTKRALRERITKLSEELLACRIKLAALGEPN